MAEARKQPSLRDVRAFTHPRPSQDLRAAVERAFALANDSRHAIVTDAHLAVGLFEDCDVQAALTACGVDLDNARDVALGTAAELPKRGWYHLWLRESSEYADAIRRAFVHAASSELEAIEPLFVLVQIVAPSSKSKFAQRADAIGIEWEPLRRFAAHGRVDEPPLSIEPGVRYDVILTNDPFTSRDFVIRALSEVLGLEEDDAVEAMLAIHHGTDLRFGPFDAAQVIHKVETLRARARAERFPLGIDAAPSSAKRGKLWRRKR
jgi:ATP-dependent Clp protease adaptor protein ClpS